MADWIPPKPSADVPDSEPPPDVEPVLPPWPLRVKAWTFFPSYTTAPGIDTSTNVNNTPEILQGLPNGAYHPLDIVHPAALAPLPDGGRHFDRGPHLLNKDVPTIMLLRYLDTAVGPYDEIIFIPGKFRHPIPAGREKAKQTTETSQRITNIYVSTPQSVWNGRRNWNIMKHLARFEWENDSKNPRQQTVKIFHPEGVPGLDSTHPFFSAMLTDSPLPTVAVRTTKPTPILYEVQPPLGGARYPPDKAKELGLEHDEREWPWIEVRYTLDGRAGIAWIKSTDKSGIVGDGISLPAMKIWRLGARFEGDMTFLHGHVVEMDWKKE
ncbi:hypothetical protein FISHEDRAFT_68494 [Fistulina hepatica ATCC 64428]|uniref:Uncharacterized protein n=1 Tax=Fistulina hepatica ATCC 64428 TaxID=1128425 RepID=A0A0D7ASZ1_9AGAR|nr:hypothetical protein FISHEDRAFT_68494 [Fistulina hepatica ATCC 64428]